MRDSFAGHVLGREKGKVDWRYSYCDVNTAPTICNN
jgi:hypothetical protein